MFHQNYGKQTDHEKYHVKNRFIFHDFHAINSYTKNHNNEYHASQNMFRNGIYLL